MLNLDGLFTVRQQRDIQKYTQIRVRDDSGLIAPEAITLYEQNFMEMGDICKLCEKVYGHVLYEPMTSIVPPDILAKFESTGAIPVVHLFMAREIQAVYLNDIEYKRITLEGYTIEYLPTSPPYYFKQYFEKYGAHPFILPIPVAKTMSIVTDEAVSLNASDITITTKFNSSLIYYNVRKRKVYSKRMFSASDMDDMVTYLFAENTYDKTSKLPQRCGANLNKDYRGRVECARKYGNGYMITIRLLPTSIFNMTYDDLNISKKSQAFLQDKFLDGDTGLHLIAGATMSGKNTTILAALRTLASSEQLKIVSVEQPVEQELAGIEQLSCDTEDEYREACFSLIRHNPDIVYITETNDHVGESVIRTANTGKCVLSTIHANGVSGTLSRLKDVTNQPIDRLIQDMHSIVYQELRRNDEEDKVYPWLRYIRLTKEIKQELYGKSLGDQIKIIEKYEEGDD